MSYFRLNLSVIRIETCLRLHSRELRLYSSAQEYTVFKERKLDLPALQLPNQSILDCIYIDFACGCGTVCFLLPWFNTRLMKSRVVTSLEDDSKAADVLSDIYLCCGDSAVHVVSRKTQVS